LARAGVRPIHTGEPAMNQNEQEVLHEEFTGVRARSPAGRTEQTDILEIVADNCWLPLFFFHSLGAGIRDAAGGRGLCLSE
jgi:hypothetical protein